MSTYRAVRSLQRALDGTSAVQKRRAAAKELLEKLLKSETRYWLALEAETGVKGVRRHKYRLLKDVWRSIMLSIVSCTDQIAKGKTKLTETDIQVFYKFLQVCDSAVEGFEDAYNAWKLSRKEVKAVLALCLDLLDDPQAKEIAELQLLEILVFICSKREYVNHFRPKEIQIIVEEAEKRIGGVEESSRARGTLGAAARMFHEVIKTAVGLGASLSSLLPGSIRLVADFCERNIRAESVGFRRIAEQSDLLDAIVVLIRSDPEQAIAPLARHGRVMLSFAKRRYPLVDDMQRNSLNHYFACHIYVCQIAGKLHGMMSGDLGDLGSASLTERQINSILDLVMRDNLRSRYLQLPVGDYHREQLELTARLLACAQRQHFSRLEWALVENPTERVLSLLQDNVEGGSYAFNEPLPHQMGPCPMSDMVTSPFVRNVLLPLHHAINVSSSKAISSDNASRLVKELNKSSQDTSSDNRHVAALLQVVSASAETFPAGECWASTAEYGWKTLTAEVRGTDLYTDLHLSAPDELTSIVEIVGDLLEANGGPTGDVGIMQWCLVCLRKLAEPTAVQSFFSKDMVGPLKLLGLAWRRVWRVLFRGDLQYAEATKNVGEGSTGDLVVWVLESMVHCFCTDPEVRWTSTPQLRQSTFLCHFQTDLWMLPRFCNARGSPSCFSLVSAVLVTVPLSESGDDKLPEVVRNDFTGASLMAGSGRRLRLLTFCLNAIDLTTDEAMLASLCYCVSLLSEGALPVFPTSSPVVQLDQSTVVPVGLRGGELLSRTRGWCGFQKTLWLPPDVDFRQQFEVFVDEIEIDIVECSRYVLAMNLAGNETPVATDYVSATTSRELLQFSLFHSLDRLVSNATEEIPVSRLVTHALAVKVALTATSRNQSPDASLLRIVSGLFGMIGTLPDAFWGETLECDRLLVYCLQIVRTLISATAVNSGFKVSADILAAATRLQNMAKDVLDDFSVDSEGELSFESSRLSRRVRDELMDDDVGEASGTEQELAEVVPAGPKRRAPVPGPRSVKRTKKSDRKLSSGTASLLAFLFLSLDPSIENCEFSVSRLLGIGRSTINDYELPTTDCRSAATAIVLLCQEPIFLKNGMTGSASVVGLLCRVLNAAMSDESADVELQSFCLASCAFIVRLAESDLTPRSLTEVEARLLGDVLTLGGDADRIVLARPSLWRAQLRAATQCFLFGKENYHAQLDKEFPRFFVLPSLSNLRGSIRREATVGVEVAVRRLPEVRVLDSVRKRLPILNAVLMMPSSANLRDVFREWYSSRDSDLVNYKAGSDVQVWDDSFLSFVCGDILCLSRIAKAASAHLVLDRAIVDILRMSLLSSVDSEDFFAFRVLDRTATALGYGDAEGLFDSEQAALIEIWMASEANSILELPLCMTAPGLVRKMVQLGMSVVVSSETFDVTRVREQSSVDFIARRSSDVVIQVLFLAASSVVASGVTKDTRRTILESKFMRELCSAYQDRFDDDVVKLVLKKHVPDILAYHAMLVIESEDAQKLSGAIMESVVSMLSPQTAQRVGAKGSFDAVRRFIDFVGRGETQQNAVDLYQGLLGMITNIGRSDYGIGAFMRVDTTSFEVLLYAKRQLANERTNRGKKRKVVGVMIVFEAVVDELNRQQVLTVPPAFYFDILASLLFDEEFLCIHTELLLVAKGLLVKLISVSKPSDSADNELKRATNLLLGISMVLHERCQKRFISACLSNERLREASLRNAVGLLGSGGGEDDPVDPSDDELFLLAESFTKYRVWVDGDVVDVLVTTFELIHLVVENAGTLCLDYEDCLSASPPYETPQAHLELLQRLDESFCAQNRIKPLLTCIHKRRHYGELPSQLAALCSDLQGAFANGQIDHFSSQPNQRRLRTELASLEVWLQEKSLNGASLSADEYGRLVRVLCRLCSANFDPGIRWSSSRCLGEMGRLSPDREDSSRTLVCDGDGGGDSVMKPDQLRLRMWACSLQAVLLGLRDSDVEIAWTSMETLTALLAFPSTAECLDWLDQDSQRVVRAHVAVSTGERRGGCRLGKNGVSAIRARAGAICGRSFSNDQWCFDIDLWKAASKVDVRSDDWVCCVVTGLIASNNDILGEQVVLRDYFSACQKLTAADPRFAKALFPAVILAILEAQPKTYRGDRDPVLDDSYIGGSESPVNATLSRCFAALLDGYVFKQENARGLDDGALHLCVETLDLFRRLTQVRFVTSQHHQKNHVILRDRNTSSTSSQGFDSQEGGMGGPPIPWRGVPFGTILRVDGLLIARANIRVGRPASALFYADLYTDCRYRNSLRSLTTFASEKIDSFDGRSTSDVSGFGGGSVHIGSLGQDGSPAEEVGTFLSILRDGFSDMGETSTPLAISRHRPSVSHGRTGVSEEDADLWRLQHLDQRLCRFSINGDIAMSMSRCMEHLGLRGILQGFLVTSEAANEELKETWFRNLLFNKRWQEDVFHYDDEDGVGGGGRHSLSTEAETSGDWTVIGRVGFYESITSAMRALRNEDKDLANVHLAEARETLIVHLPAFAQSERPFSFLIDTMDKLEAVNNVQLVAGSKIPFASLQVFDQLGTKINCTTGVTADLVNHTPRFANGPFHDCVNELVIRLDISKAVRSGDSEVARKLEKLLFGHLIYMFDDECSSGGLATASGVLQRLSTLNRTWGDDPMLKVNLQLREAMLLEKRGEFTLALRHSLEAISRLRQEKESSAQTGLLSEALVASGRWMSRHKVEPARSVLDTYLIPGSELAMRAFEVTKSAVGASRATSAIEEVGRLAFHLFESVSDRVESQEWKKAGQLLSARESEISKCDKLLENYSREYHSKSKSKGVKEIETKMHDTHHYKVTLSRDVANARAEREKVEQSIDYYLSLSLKSLISVLSVAGDSGRNDLSMQAYRVVSLWFKSQDIPTSKVFFTTTDLSQVPSFRFVPLASQLFSRLTTAGGRSAEEFHAVLEDLLVRMCLDHPYHCLVNLIFLSNRRKVGAGVSMRNAASYLENIGHARDEAANKLLRRLERENDRLRGLIESYQAVSHAYMHLSMANVDQFHPSEKVSFSKVGSQAANRLDQCLGIGSRRLDFPPCVLTRTPSIRPKADYGNLANDGNGAEFVVGFEKTFCVAEGGRSKPRIVVCIGSRGGRFKQLVKGNDEIRQDAVMEQVFVYVNELMARVDQDNYVSPHGARCPRSDSELKVRTYSVVPLSPTSGVLEWVEHTRSFFGCINDSKSSNKGPVALHSRYFPGEWPHRKCSKHLENAPPREKRKAFEEICSLHSPCFRFFFVEQFGHCLASWYAARAKYTRSVAVSSVIGHILGIGDRHGGNILIHEKSGEVVHIDFGIVFEQGKVLPIPEQIPFRLTRNIVDGMGPTGTEGLFTYASETTLGVLKHNAGALLTILSAVVADPLYTWSMSPVKAREMQGGEGQDGISQLGGDDGEADGLSAGHNEAGSQAVAKVQQKLQGYEDGTSGEQQSVTGQIQMLVNAARDPEKLCEIYHGWGPWV